MELRWPFFCTKNIQKCSETCNKPRERSYIIISQCYASKEIAECSLDTVGFRRERGWVESHKSSRAKKCLTVPRGAINLGLLVLKYNFLVSSLSCSFSVVFEPYCQGIRPVSYESLHLSNRTFCRRIRCAKCTSRE